MVELLPPSAQVVILGFWDRVPHRAPHREPDVGLDPRTPGSRPELKADVQPLSHSGAPLSVVIFLRNVPAKETRGSSRLTCLPGATKWQHRTSDGKFRAITNIPLS